MKQLCLLFILGVYVLNLRAMEIQETSFWDQEKSEFYKCIAQSSEDPMTYVHAFQSSLSYEEKGVLLARLEQSPAIEEANFRKIEHMAQSQIDPSISETLLKCYPAEVFPASYSYLALRVAEAYIRAADRFKKKQCNPDRMKVLNSNIFSEKSIRYAFSDQAISEISQSKEKCAELVMRESAKRLLKDSLKIHKSTAGLIRLASLYQAQGKHKEEMRLLEQAKGMGSERVARVNFAKLYATYWPVPTDAALVSKEIKAMLAEEKEAIKKEQIEYARKRKHEGLEAWKDYIVQEPFLKKKKEKPDDEPHLNMFG